ncbi:MAG: hypothetical protein ACI82A_000104 [Candidatus Azotimanducaceae bacterium]
MTSPTSHMEARITLALSLLGLILGIFISAGVLAGDEQGRVNLLFLLLLFAFLPLLSLLLSLALLLIKHNGLTALLLSLPFWPKEFLQAQVSIGLGHRRRSWLFFESQVLSLAFAAGSIIVFIALLLGTDVNFVWRSTLLEATDLLPVLQLISIPWAFWNAAQPSLDLLQQSQNSRITGSISAYSENWWQFVLAAQLTYNLIPRAVLLVLARWKYKKKAKLSSQFERDKTTGIKQHLSDPETLASVVYSLPDAYQLLDWNNAPEHCQRFISQAFGQPIELCPLTANTDVNSLQGSTELISRVVLVKSWEPPLGELKDVLSLIELPDSPDSQLENFILPLDWDDTSIKPASTTHLQEWQRFAASLSSSIEQWKVLQPGEHS